MIFPCGESAAGESPFLVLRLKILASISLAQFLVVMTLCIGVGVLIYNFRDKFKDFLENYRKKENNKESLMKKLEECNNRITTLERHHEEDMELNHTNQTKYRQQSIDKQNQIDKKFSCIQDDIVELKDDIKNLTALINKHYEDTKRLKRNELREKLLSSFRHYTSLELNPKQEWNEMEAEAFWHLFSDYEKLSGNGYMHSTVKPAMEKLTVVPF